MVRYNVELEGMYSYTDKPAPPNEEALYGSSQSDDLSKCEVLYVCVQKIDDCMLTVIDWIFACHCTLTACDQFPKFTTTEFQDARKLAAVSNVEMIRAKIATHFTMPRSPMCTAGSERCSDCLDLVPGLECPRRGLYTIVCPMNVIAWLMMIPISSAWTSAESTLGPI